MSENVTKPTMQTILERIDAQTEEMRKGFATVEKLFDKVAVRLDRIADEAADDLALVIRDEVGDVIMPYDARRLFHPEAHRVVGHAHRKTP